MTIYWQRVRVGGGDYELMAGGRVPGLAPGSRDGWQWSWRQPWVLPVFKTSPQVFLLQRITPFSPLALDRAAREDAAAASAALAREAIGTAPDL